MATVPLQFQVLDELVSVEVEPARERLRLNELLPVLRVLDDRFIDVAIRKSAKPVTCAKGCSACCRIQPVPVTPEEAYDLWLLVRAMSEPRRSEILARFTDCVAKLEAAGLAETYLEGRPAASAEEAKANVRRYLDLALVCPFLEGDACSIYAERPFTCREYLVSSPKEYCTDPIENPIERVGTLVSGARAIMGTTAGLTGRLGYTLPLTLALVFANSHADSQTETYPGYETWMKAIQALLATHRRAAPRAVPR